MKWFVRRLNILRTTETFHLKSRDRRFSYPLVETSSQLVRSASANPKFSHRRINEHRCGFLLYRLQRMTMLLLPSTSFWSIRWKSQTHKSHFHYLCITFSVHVVFRFGSVMHLFIYQSVCFRINLPKTENAWRTCEFTSNDLLFGAVLGAMWRINCEKSS